MGYPTIVKTWTMSFNNRYTFATVIGAMQAFAFSLKEFLKTTMGYTVKGSSNGTTAAMDGTDRWITAANVTPRANSSSSAIAWFVLTDGQGVDWCLAFNSASDDIFRLSHSSGGNYVAAGTATFQPTATDECFDAASTTWVNATASADRVWHMWGSSDKKIWRAGVYRSGVLASYLAGQQFTSTILNPCTLTVQTGGGTAAVVKSFYNGTSRTAMLNATYAAATNGDLFRYYAAGDTNVKITFGGEMVGDNIAYCGTEGAGTRDLPRLQGASSSPMYPAQLGGITVGFDGKAGTMFDHWYTISSSATVPAIMDTYGTKQFLVVTPGGAVILPHDGSTVVVAT